MVVNLGNVPAGSTLYVPFTTYNTAGASVTITGLATTDIEIYKNGSVTQRSSDNGYTLLDTDGIDFDGITGLHGFSIDLSDNSDASFYAAGSTYWLVVSTITVDSQTVTFCYYFTIDKASAANVTQWLGTAAATPTVAGVPEVDVTHWIGTAAATPTTAGVPEVDLTFIAGSAVSTTTAQLGVNVVQISADGTAADNLELAFDDTAGAVPWQGIIDQGTMQAGSTGTTAVLRAAASFADDVLIGATIHITGGTGIGQRRLVTDWVSATDTATVDTWVTTPDNTSVYKVFATAPSSGGGSAPSAAEVADAVWDEATAGHTTSGTFGEQLKTDVDAILVDTAEIGAAGAGLTNINLPNQTMDIIGNITGNLSGSVGSVTGAVGSVTGAVGSVTGSVGSVTGLTAADVGAIKLKTDSLTFTTANLVDARTNNIAGITLDPSAGTGGQGVGGA